MKANKLQLLAWTDRQTGWFLYIPKLNFACRGISNTPLIKDRFEKSTGFMMFEFEVMQEFKPPKQIYLSKYKHCWSITSIYNIFLNKAGKTHEQASYYKTWWNFSRDM